MIAIEHPIIQRTHVRDADRRRNAKRRELFDAQDAIDQQREGLIGKIEKQLSHRTTETNSSATRWAVS